MEFRQKACRVTQTFEQSSQRYFEDYVANDPPKHKYSLFLAER